MNHGDTAPYHAAVIVALWSLAGAESTAQPQPLVERVDVARVLIDVRVVDDDGQPILGLEPADFKVLIDGEPVRVESALWVGDDSGNDAGDGGAAVENLRSTEIAGFLEPENRGQLIVFLVQKSLQPVRALGLLRLLMHSDRLLAQVSPADRVAVLSFDSHLKIWLDFSADLERVETVLADEVMFGRPPLLEPQGELSLLATLSQDEGRRTWEIQEALLKLGEALEPLPRAKSVILIGCGFGQFSVPLGILDERYDEARAALEAARASVFTLDVTQGSYHRLEHGLQAVAEDTGGFFVRTYLRPRRAIDRVANAIAGRYVLLTERPDVEPGEYPIEVDVGNLDGMVLARSTYVARRSP